MAKPIGTLGTIDTLTIGGRVFTDLTNLIYLFGAANVGGDSSTLRKPSGSSGYQVTTGKTLTIYAIKYQIFNGTATGGGPLIGYADNDVGTSSATALTNPVYHAGDSNFGGFSVNLTVSGTYNYLETAFSVPALKYSFMSCLSSTAPHSVAAFGYET